ncbi:MAG: ribonuclease R [Candidatus Cloacimonetes bacterium]|nr:ribonuclease R [Candidatus Cloacimonadota bacterium]
MSKRIKSSKILYFFRKNSSKKFSSAELARILRIKKQKYKNLRKILYKLEKQNLILRKGKKYFIIPQYSVIVGTFDAIAISKGYSFAFVRTEKNDIKIPVKQCLNAYNDDIVEVQITKKTRNGFTGKIQKIVERKNKTIVGNCFKTNEKYLIKPDNTRFHNIVEVINANDEIYKKKILIEITNWGNYTKNILPAGKVIEIIGDFDDPKIDFISIIKQFNLPEKFPDTVLQESKKFSETIVNKEVSRRKDFRNLTTFTIDPITAKDFDDAISFEDIATGYRLYVHIADVSEFAKVNSPTLREAFERGTSIYLLQDVIPMLPQKLSNDLCSLKPNRDRLTISVIIDYDKNFKIVHRNVVPSIIRSDARLSYDQVDKLFEEKNENDIDPKIGKILLKLRPLAKHLTKQRYARGGLDFDLPDSEFEFDENGSPINIMRVKTTESHLLIEECMLEANQFVSELIAQKCNAGIFRIHEPPDSVKMGEFALLVKSYNYTLNFSNSDKNMAIKEFLDSIQNENHHRVFDTLLLRNLMKAKYSHQNIGHFGLALDSYTHFTSPIRRFPDLVVHHLLKQFVFKWTESRFSINEIKMFSQKSSEMELVALNAERAIGKLKKNRFMMDNIGKSFRALIVNFNKKNIFVELDEYPIEGFIPLSSLSDDYYQFNSEKYFLIGKRSRQKFLLGQQIKVRVKNVESDIEFQLKS